MRLSFKNIFTKLKFKFLSSAANNHKQTVLVRRLSNTLEFLLAHPSARLTVIKRPQKLLQGRHHIRWLYLLMSSILITHNRTQLSTIGYLIFVVPQRDKVSTNYMLEDGSQGTLPGASKVSKNHCMTRNWTALHMEVCAICSRKTRISSPDNSRGEVKVRG